MCIQDIGVVWIQIHAHEHARNVYEHARKVCVHASKHNTHVIYKPLPFTSSTRTTHQHTHHYTHLGVRQLIRLHHSPVRCLEQHRSDLHRCRHTSKCTPTPLYCPVWASRITIVLLCHNHRDRCTPLAPSGGPNGGGWWGGGGAGGVGCECSGWYEGGGCDVGHEELFIDFLEDLCFTTQHLTYVLCWCRTCVRGRTCACAVYALFMHCLCTAMSSSLHEHTLLLHTYKTHPPTLNIYPPQPTHNHLPAFLCAITSMSAMHCHSCISPSASMCSKGSLDDALGGALRLAAAACGGEGG